MPEPADIMDAAIGLAGLQLARYLNDALARRSVLMQSKMMGPYRIYSDRHIRVGRRERPHPITGVPLVAQPVDIVGPLYHQGQALLTLQL
jgi:hypothetical protein